MICFFFVTVIFELVFAQSCSVSNGLKIDCHQFSNASCTNAGCCWMPVNPNPNNFPWCYYPANHFKSCTLKPATTKPFDQTAVSTMQQLMLQNINIQGKGGVLASPDTMVPGGGSYYYAWMRDAGLSMRTVLRTFPNNTAAEQKILLQRMYDWANWVVRVQAQPDPNGIDIRAEPKFNLPNGDVFTGGWCRPQNDGPAIRSSTLILFANILLDIGQPSFVNSNLWTGNPSKYNGGSIADDLDFVSQNWQTSSCDLWEEVRDPTGDFLWNLVHYKISMTLGSRFAARMGDAQRSKTYASVSAQIDQQLANHWNGNFIYETLTAGRELDSAVIGALKFNYDLAEYNITLPFGTASGPMIAATIQHFNDYWCSAYQINQMLSNTSGMLYGRYAGDSYGGGNPWILATAQLAQLLFEASNDIKRIGSKLPQATFNAWAALLDPSLKPKTAAQLAAALYQVANGVLERLESLVVPYKYHLSEQLDRNFPGAEMSATDLTWSYADVLSAIYYRDNM